jgi:DNA-binding CsgD family transcriptional regulator
MWYNIVKRSVMKIEELYKNLTPKQRRRTEMRAEGLLQREIAQIEGCHQTAVGKSLRQSQRIVARNIKDYLNPPPPDRPNTFDYSVMRIKDAPIRRVRMYEQGLRVSDIARIEGISPQATSQSIKREQKIHI